MHAPIVPIEDGGTSSVIERDGPDSQTPALPAASNGLRIHPNDLQQGEVNVNEASRSAGEPVHIQPLQSGPAADPVTDGLRHLRSVLYPGREVRSNPLSAFEAAIASWAAEIAAVEGLASTFARWSSPWAYGAVLAGVANDALHGSFPRFQDLALGAIGLAGLEGSRRGLDWLASEAMKASADQVMLSPRLDSLGQDRTREVADLLGKVLSHAPSEEHRFKAVVALVCAIGTFPGYSEALADLASARNRKMMEAALDAILAEVNKPATDMAAPALQPIHRDVRCMNLCIEKRRADTTDAIDELMERNPSFKSLMDMHEKSERGVRGDSPLNDDAIHAVVANALGGRAPLLRTDDGGLAYVITQRMANGLKKSRSDILKECFQEALGLLEPMDEGHFDGWLDELITQARRDMMDRAAKAEARDAVVRSR
jgi:hypothetical protein